MEEQPSSGLLRWDLLIKLVSINRTHLSRPEDGRTAIFRNIVNFRLYIYIYYILFTIKTMDKVQQTSCSQCRVPSSKRFRIQDTFSSEYCTKFSYITTDDSTRTIDLDTHTHTHHTNTRTFKMVTTHL